METLKHSIGLILNDDAPETPLKRKVGLFILFLIVLSSIQVILESIVSLNTIYHYQFFIIDGIVSIIFSLEYILRLWSYKIKNEQPTLKERISYVFSFYMLIDLISILPFFISIFISNGYGFLRIIRILRLFRLMKFARYMKSQNLVINAIKNKGKELILSMQVVVFLTVILSAILYHIEFTVQPENFGDIVDAFIWSLSKFIGGVGGYGDFEPITFWGQVMATIVGLLGIALFAVPAGIIGAGFVEEIEAIKSDEDLVKKNRLLLDTFKFDHLGSHKRAKKHIGLEHIRRKILKESDIERRLLLNKEDLTRIAREGHGIKLRTFNEKGIDIPIVEAFEENTIYGTLIDKKSNITIVSPVSCNQAFLGHFSYSIAEYLNCNYISNEKLASTNFLPEFQISLLNNKAYLSEDNHSNSYIKEFKKDLLDTIREKSLVVYFNISNSKYGSFHILNGGLEGENKFTNEESTYNNLNKLEKFYKSFEKDLNEYDQTSDKLFSRLNKHKFYGNKNKEGFQWMLKRNRNTEIIYIYVSRTVINSNPENYYSIIKILGDNIKNNLR